MTNSTFKFFFGLFFLSIALMASKCNEEDPDVTKPGIQIVSPEAAEAYSDGRIPLNIVFTDDQNLDEFMIRITSEDGGLTPVDTLGIISGKETILQETKVVHVPDHSDYIITVVATDESGNTEQVSLQFHLHPTEHGGDAGALKINFKLEYDGQPMVMTNLDGYPYPGNDMPFFLNRFSYFLSGIELLTSHGHTEKLASADTYLNLELDHQDANSAVEGTTYHIHGVTAGEYTGIRYSIGVPPGVNAQTPNQFSGDSPYSLDGEYWPAWNSYVFCKIEGRGDENGDSVYEDPVMALHLGDDEAMRTLEFTKDIHLHAGGEHTLEFIIDVKKIFDNNGDIYDLLGETNGDSNARLHKLTQLPLINELADNLVQAIEIQ